MKAIGIVAFALGFVLQASAETEFEMMSVAMYYDHINEAHRAFRAADYDKAFELYSVCARWGEKDCQRQLGVMYLAGEGTNVDAVEGYAWLKLAAESKRRADTEPLKEAERKLPDMAVEAGEQMYAQYLPLYGLDATGIRCKRKKIRDSGRKETVCERPSDMQSARFKVPVVD